METLSALLARALQPRKGFLDRFQAAPTLAEAVREMLMLRVPVAFLGMVFSYVGFQAFYVRLANPQSEFWTQVLRALPEAVDPQALGEALAGLPVLPSLLHALPVLALLAPLMVLSLWLHDATFDHLALGLLGALRGRASFRTTLVAEAEALKVGVIGAALGLLPLVPATGFALTLAVAPVAVYFWILRGHALAAWHGCPVWKGITATLLNVVLAAALLLVLIAACVVMVLVLI